MLVMLHPLHQDVRASHLAIRVAEVIVARLVAHVEALVAQVAQVVHAEAHVGVRAEVHKGHKKRANWLSFSLRHELVV